MARLKLPVMKREGRAWVVLAVHDSARLNSFFVDCVALDTGERRDFRVGGKWLDGIKEQEVVITLA